MTGKLWKRFWDKVDVSDDNSCWEWTASKTRYGYGRIGVDRKTYKAHRIAWYLNTGEMPNLLVCHKCDNPPCCNPRHLFLGTHKDNQRDKVNKGRQSKGIKHALRPRGRGETAATAKLREDEVRTILRSKKSLTSLAKEYGVSKKQIFRIKHKQAWSHVNE